MHSTIRAGLQKLDAPDTAWAVADFGIPCRIHGPILSVYGIVENPYLYVRTSTYDASPGAGTVMATVWARRCCENYEDQVTKSLRRVGTRGIGFRQLGV